MFTLLVFSRMNTSSRINTIVPATRLLKATLVRVRSRARRRSRSSGVGPAAGATAAAPAAAGVSVSTAGGGFAACSLGGSAIVPLLPDCRADESCRAGTGSAAAAHRRRPDALLAGREDAVRIDGVLDLLVEAALRVVGPAVLLLCEVHEVEVRAVLAVALLRRLAHEQLAGVVG